MKEVLRKCQYCDKEKGIKSIKVDTEDYIKDNRGYWHTKCYIEKQKKTKNNKLSDEEINIKILEIKSNMDEQEKKLVDRDRLTYWIYENYDTNVLPTSFFNKLELINSGTYKGLKNGIDNESILEIFKKMKLYLDKNADKVSQKGKSFKTTASRINYDLSVVINNYDQYKKWKTQQVTNTMRDEKQDKYIEEKNEYKNILNSHNSKSKEDKKDEVVSIVDLINEIF